MNKMLPGVLLVLMILLVGCGNAADSAAGSEVAPGLPVKDTVTMVDLGAKTCVPCKMMAPILEELKEEYKGRAEVIFIDVWEPANKGMTQAFKVMAIPTQIFYDRQGREVFRHVGFFDKKSIAAKLEELLAQ
jgi:thioredoxin 1